MMMLLLRVWSCRSRVETEGKTKGKTKGETEGKTEGDTDRAWRSPSAGLGAALVAVVLVGPSGLLAAAPMAGGPRLMGRRSRDRGAALFLGEMPLRGSLRGTFPGDANGSLPPEVVVCANCHGGGGGGPFAQVKPLGPSLVRASLVEPRSRRGGPPSVYDLAGFCRLLRTGIDPVSVLIAREMPRYDIDDQECGELWRYLTRERRIGGGRGDARR